MCLPDFILLSRSSSPSPHRRSKYRSLDEQHLGEDMATRIVHISPSRRNSARCRAEIVVVQDKRRKRPRRSYSEDSMVREEGREYGRGRDLERALRRAETESQAIRPLSEERRKRVVVEKEEKVEIIERQRPAQAERVENRKRAPSRAPLFPTVEDEKEHPIPAQIEKKETEKEKKVVAQIATQDPHPAQERPKPIQPAKVVGPERMPSFFPNNAPPPPAPAPQHQPPPVVAYPSFVPLKRHRPRSPSISSLSTTSFRAVKRKLSVLWLRIGKLEKWRHEEGKRKKQEEDERLRREREREREQQQQREREAYACRKEGCRRRHGHRHRRHRQRRGHRRPQTGFSQERRPRKISREEQIMREVEQDKNFVDWGRSKWNWERGVD